jgi:hypothetical protein
MTKPMLILESPLSGKIYATKSYKWIDETKGTLVVTGKKEDVTEQVEAIIQKRLEQNQ